MAYINKNEEYINDLKKIKKDFREKVLKPYYFLYGNEEYLIDEIVDSIIKTNDDETGLNFKLYTKENFVIEEVIKYILTLPIISERKLILFKDIPFFRSTKEDDNVKNVLKSLESAKEQNIVVVVDHFASDDKYVKYFGKDNRIVSFFKNEGICIDLHRLDEATLNKYIVSKFAKSGKTIDKVEAAYIIRNCGKNLKNIYNECDKVISYLGEKNNVERKDLDVVLTKNIEDNVFNLINLVNNNKMEEAVSLYSDLLSNGEKSSNMFAVLANNYKNLLIVKEYLEKSKSQNDISKLMGIEPWRVNNLIQACKYTTKETLIKKIGVVNDLSIKRFNDTLSEDLIFEILYLGN